MFYCDEKFTLGHKCKVKQAFLIEPGYFESEGLEETINEPENRILEISMHAVLGVHGPKTMKFTAWVKKCWVVVFIDNVLSHNFFCLTKRLLINLI